jgi:cation diffusion facilitator family transporter
MSTETTRSSKHGLHPSDRRELAGAMRLSVAAGLLMLGIKSAAYVWTGSSAIFSDAAESVVHVIAVGFAAYSLWLSWKPADEQHPYGHAKISFFSAGAEGALIVIAALFILYTAVSDWMGGLSLRRLDLGIALTAIAAAINAGLGLYLVRLGRRRASLVLEANGEHVLTDSWTSLGVVIGLLLAWTTGWLFLDPVCAILVAANIIVSGVRLIRRSVGGLMDQADPAVQRRITALLDEACAHHGISHHFLRQRFNGTGYDVDVHLVFPDELPLREAHRVATEIERAIESAVQPTAHVTTHLEPRDDHRRLHPESTARL